MNASVIGPSYDKPKLRLSGGGGIASLSCMKGHRVMMFLTQHSKRTLVERVDFVTGAGYLEGGDSRARAGVAGKGPRLLVSNLGVFGFEEESKRMEAVSLHPGVSRSDVESETGFELLWPDRVTVTKAPSPSEIHLVEEVLDPEGIRHLGSLPKKERRVKIREICALEARTYLA